MVKPAVGTRLASSPPPILNEKQPPARESAAVTIESILLSRTLGGAPVENPRPRGGSEEIGSSMVTSSIRAPPPRAEARQGNGSVE